MKIREVKTTDIPSILKLQDELNFKNTKNPDRGVLMFPIDEEKVNKMLFAGGNISLIAEEENEIVGFLFAYPISEFKKISTYWSEKLTKVIEGENIDSDKVFYYEYLASKEGTKGVGMNLFKEFESQIDGKQYTHLICEILHKPLLNTNSITFHENRGFSLVDKVPYEATDDIPQMLWGVYLKELE